MNEYAFKVIDAINRAGITMNLNGVSREIAEKYTDSELREVLRLLKLKANF